MKTKVKMTETIGLLAFLLMFVFDCTYAQPVDYGKLADNIVNKAIQVKPGDVVIITGNKVFLDLMEQLAMKVDLAGGRVTMDVYSDDVSYSYWKNVPIEYLKRNRNPKLDFILSADAFILLPTCNKCDSIYKYMSEEKQKASSTTDEEMQKIRSSKMRQYNLDIPVGENAKIYGFSSDEYQAMIWKAIEFDVSSISDRCSKFNDLLTHGKSIKITSPDGTNFTAMLEGRQCIKNDGVISDEELVSGITNNRFASYPAGSLFVIPVQSSANGTIVSRNDATSRVDLERLKMVKSDIKNGEIVNVSAEQGEEAVKKYMSEFKENDKKLGGIWFGLNPEISVGTDPAFFIFEAEGMVHIFFGGNQDYGGSNISNDGWNFPVMEATVEIDGKVVFKDGKWAL